MSPFLDLKFQNLSFLGSIGLIRSPSKGGEHSLVTLALGASKYGETLKQKMKITDVVINPPNFKPEIPFFA